MNHLKIKVAAGVFLVALLAMSGSSAEARWKPLATLPAVFDLYVCRDGVQLQVINNTDIENIDTVKIYARSLAGDSDILASQRDVHLAAVDNFIIPAYDRTANQNRFTSIKWNRELPPGFVVELVFTTPKIGNEAVPYVVRDCSLSKLALDKFDRSNGSVGNGWLGNTSGYQISNQRLRANKGGGAIYWKTGTWQQASVVLSKIDRVNNGEQGLLLMVQGATPSIENGAIRAVYASNAQQVHIDAFLPNGPSGAHWYRLLSKPAVFNDGDTLGALALDDASDNLDNLESSHLTIMITKKSPSDNVTLLLGVVDPNNVVDQFGNPVDLSFFIGKSGRLGLWFDNAPQAEVDQFYQAITVP